MSRDFIVPGGAGTSVEQLAQSTLSISRGNGAVKTESYTFQSSCSFLAVIAQANEWNDTSLADITANSGVSESTKVTLAPTHTQSGGGATVVMTGKAKKGAVITFSGRLRSDGPGKATFPYTVFSV